ncbi:MerC domain-containing protein [Flammeovirgaceae bacterium SG7u.111]|nr:MerC domain-containing protein [Flammeovirgaceae bacterium SG7u.132]WPO33636.1 MerC domain-containing protein [Flammeovirgaceae bacterium SG7u.111]
MKERLLKYADLIGISGSVLCLIHCLAVPIIALFSAGLTSAHQHLGVGNDIIFMFVCLVAVYFAVRTAASSSIKIALWVFMGTFFISMSLGRNFHELEWMEYLAHISTLGLIITHIVNIKEKKKTVHCKIPMRQVEKV